MPWVRIDEEFPQHPKVVKAGPLGLAMQVAALCYCNRYLTDGFVPRAVAATLLNFDGLGMRMWMGELTGGGEDADWPLVVQDLEDAGLWEQVEGGWQIHDYHDYQPSREHVLALRQTRQGVGSKGGKASGEARRKQSRSKLLSNQQATREANDEAKTNPGPVPVPHRVTKGDPSAETSVVSTGVEQAQPIDDVVAVFHTWVATLGDNRGRLRLTPKRRTVIKARLADYPAADVIDAARGWVNDPWPERPHHNDLTVLLRNGEQLEKFRDLWRHGPPATMGKHTSQAVQFAHQMQAMRPGEGVTDDLGRMDGRGAVAQRQLPRPEA